MDRQTFGSGQGWTCPECGRRNSAESEFCVGCGRRRAAPENPYQEAPGYGAGYSRNNDPYYGPNDYGQAGGYTPPQPPKSGGALKIIAILLGCLVAAVAIGFGVSRLLLDRTDDPQPVPDDGTEQIAGDEDGDTEGEDDDDAITDYRTAYAEVLRQNETAIRNYDWQTDTNKNMMVNNVLLHDLNGDGTPELLFFAADEDYAADLHVYTMGDDGAEECVYYVDADHTNHSSYGLLRDAYAAAGTRYMVYTGKQPGTFYLAHYISDTSGFYYSVKLSMGSDGTISEEGYVYNYVDLEDKDIDEYTVDDNDVSMEEGVKVFKAHREDYRDLLMASGYDKDMKVFEKLKNDSPAATDYDDVMSSLGA